VRRDKSAADTRQRENWHGERRNNEKREPRANNQARLFGQSDCIGVLLCRIGLPLTDNRHAQVTPASDTAECHAAAEMLVDAARLAANRVTPHLTGNEGRTGSPAIYG
jgi:hypothetical protein